MKATITYDVVTDESAEHGDTVENGWWSPGGWHDALRGRDGQQNEAILHDARNGAYDLPLYEAFKYAKDLGCSELVVCGSRVSIGSEQGHVNACSGDTFNYALHVECKSER